MLTKNYYLYTPWERDLIEHAKRVKHSIILVCPFIKLPIIKKLLAALPDENKVSIRILTRFSIQVFTQGSSDLSVFDVMVNYASKKHDVSIHRLDNVHAKIFLFDESEMFLTSSNLSYSGLNLNFEIAVKISNADEVKNVRAVIEPLLSEDALITAEAINNMAQKLKTRTRSLIQSGELKGLKLEAVETPMPLIQESILSDLEESEEDPTHIVDAPKQERTLDDINRFLVHRAIEEYNQIEGTSFESTQRPDIKGQELSDEELSSFRNYWCEKAAHDEEFVTEHLHRVFGKILADDEDKVKKLKENFLHSTWKHVYRTQPEDDYLAEYFRTLGKALIEFLIAQQLVEKRLFSEERIFKFSTSLQYIVSNYPYGNILSDINCRFLLHFQHISPELIDKEIFVGLLGCLVTCLPSERFYELYENIFNKLDEFIYDDYFNYDYKTSLQEMSQKKYGQAIYKVISKSGLEHELQFEVAVFLGNKEFGRGSGRSKHQAEIEAAYEAIKNAAGVRGFQTEHHENQWRKLKSYGITGTRIEELATLRQRLPVKISNLRLLDVALTHVSYINEHKEKRSNRKLSFYGSYIDLFLRAFNLYGLLKGIVSEEGLDYVNHVLKLSPNQSFEYWFDKWGLRNLLNRVKNLDEIPAAAKVETIQAIIAVVFIDRGMDAAREFVHGLWENFIQVSEQDQLESYVSKIQRAVQEVKRDNAKLYITYEVVRESKLPQNKMEYEVACLIEGKEYGRGIGPNKRIARTVAATNAYNNQLFIQKYLSG